MATDQGVPEFRAGEGLPASQERPADAERGSADRGGEPELVDWGLAGRRLVTSGLGLLALALAAWVGTSIVSGTWDPGVLGNFVGLALAGVFLVEVWVVGGSALRGMLRAGEAGHRLAGSDVGLLPPQLRPGGTTRLPLVDAFTDQGPEPDDGDANGPVDGDGGHGEDTGGDAEPPSCDTRPGAGEQSQR